MRARGLVAGAAMLLLAAIIGVSTAPSAPPVGASAAATVAASTSGTVSAATSSGTPAAATSAARKASATSAPTPAAAPLTVVGLGDSIESGYHCDCTNFVAEVAQRIGDAQGRPVKLANRAVPGAVTQDVLDQLTATETRQTVAASDLVIVEIGANDFAAGAADLYRPECLPDQGGTCFAATEASMRRNLDSIVAQVRGLQTRPGAQVVVLGYWNVFVDGAVGRAQGDTYVAGADQVSQRVNRAAVEVAAQHGVVYADAYAPFKGDGSRDDTPLLADDGEHPDAAGHAALAEAVLGALGPRALQL